MTADYLSLIEAGHVWIAEEAGRIVGLLVLEVQSDHLPLENINGRVGGAWKGSRTSIVVLRRRAVCASEVKH